MEKQRTEVGERRSEVIRLRFATPREVRLLPTRRDTPDEEVGLPRRSF